MLMYVSIDSSYGCVLCFSLNGSIVSSFSVVASSYILVSSGCSPLPKPFYSKHPYEAKPGSRTAHTPNSGLVLFLPRKHVEPWPPMAITAFSSLSMRASSPMFSQEDMTIFWNLVIISHLPCGPWGLKNQLGCLDGTPGASEKVLV